MPTRNVVLTDHQAHFVEQLVASGRYQNASEVLREGLRLVERRGQSLSGPPPISGAASKDRGLTRRKRKALRHKAEWSIKKDFN